MEGITKKDGMEGITKNMIWRELQKRLYKGTYKKDDIEGNYKKDGMKGITKKMVWEELQ